MPYINATVSTKLSEEKRETIKAKLGEIICKIPGKSEQWLMISFNDNNSIYFRGNIKEKAAFIEVKIYGSTNRKTKNEIAKDISNVFEGELGILKDNIYLTFEEIQDWAWNGALF
ncbi:phenylpyruvate tautomerase PptA (4-oxalocrotonate tautomerase family) [Clostridium tetanomorphum]|uniref:L-dopachrome isomerase n=1 Tax=Clostridium tetanomorphum TaxID=1553 RepID=A0A923J041_CLOTT|nr:phenylpyruvate tautomerase MIF-related protein [Clostridium tetanomorphum]KAJ51781.1 MIFH/DOPD protein family [Clostridium tetanomorphum DSM 665]MBC2397662.1 hypothetical protein [Clostridium tetanomorphum]MBP1865016.1 phenylpyruvate tautomerase PptA (4-oxalocrotonate tautomerase family) [Clostridium tetanomorphum]NRS83387.1 phenylpyruvate tautomerase PptA (4-oxalocrotonate tautomerase family) [Clostridium tetanomorphum]NRZ96586.1 phenylpyruvate tautomerase PptA (4-oxalocrotonate tautomeras